jgi:hypothetical protein
VLSVSIVTQPCIPCYQVYDEAVIALCSYESDSSWLLGTILSYLLQFEIWSLTYMSIVGTLMGFSWSGHLSENLNQGTAFCSIAKRL